jgi:hypothetical protein
MPIRPWRFVVLPLVWPTLFAAMLALSACGGSRTSTGLIKRVNPPSASLERLAATDPAAPVRLAVRMQNFSTVATRFERIEAAIGIDGWPAGQLVASPGIEIPGLSSDVIEIDWSPTADERTRIDAAARGGRALRYRLEGTIETSEPSGTFEFEFESRLTPVPGRPGEFR